jgi:membrane fusion protein (multidrug efflux system)
MARRHLVAFALLGGGFAAGAVSAGLAVAPRTAAPPSASAGAPAAPPSDAGFAQLPPAAVQVARVTRGEVRRTLTGIGTLRAAQSVPIASLTGGVVVAADFTEGGPVQQGAALVEFDRRIAAAQLEAAEGQVRLAAVRVQRGQDLTQSGFRSRQQQDDDRTALQQAQSDVAVRRTTLEQLTLRAPFSGVAGQRFFGIGEYVPAGRTLLWLEDRRTLRVEFRLPERFLPFLHVGQTFEAEVDAVAGRIFTGRVVLIDTRPDQNQRSVQLRGEIPNADLALPSGVFARISLVTSRLPQALIVPPSAVQYTMSGASVFRVVDGKAQRVQVRTGIQMADRVEIVEGLSEGDTVVTLGQFNLDDGRRVTVANEATGTR